MLEIYIKELNSTNIDELRTILNPDVTFQLVDGRTIQFVLDGEIRGQLICLSSICFKTNLPEIKLTPRQQEVLDLLVEGLSNREIGQRLVTSEKNVEQHMHKIFGKLGVRSRSQAVRYVITQGLVGFVNNVKRQNEQGEI